ncbi:hypothetical protein [Cyanobium sp. AMD-g]|uniref:hypothetical protein n=1 Tax=Cyanobium sp. AMD-g TaxID=2823699 RepID=UPI0020CFDED4|nr:hypothetical protein [Cyanobium sp. AMD-g]
MGKTPILRILFFRSHSGREPARERLLDQKREDRKAIGSEIKTAQYGWPLGIPLIRKLEPGLREVRSDIDKVLRVLFSPLKMTP